MRNILIDKNFHDDIDSFYRNLFQYKQSDPIQRLVVLRDSFRGFSCKKKQKRAYIKAIIDDYANIVRVKPDDVQGLKDQFNKIIPSSKIEESFHKSITKEMMYPELRDEMLPLIQKLNIKSCVYCNAQLTAVVDVNSYKRSSIKHGYKKGDIKVRSGRFELDHFYPKSEYPFLSTSFYNLIPCCSNCNKNKSSKPALFQLYTENPSDLEVFEFVLTDDSKDNYIKSKGPRDLEVEFIHSKGDVKMLKNHKDLFHIDQLYKTQFDVIEELANIEQAYNSDSKKDLIENYKKLFPDKSIVNRLLIGNYDRPEDIHKRPLAKFTQDLARELKIIE